MDRRKGRKPKRTRANGCSPVGVPISVVVTQKVILSHHLVSGDFQGLVNRRQEIFAQTGDLAERKEKAETGLEQHVQPRLANGNCDHITVSTLNIWPLVLCQSHEPVLFFSTCV